MLKSLLKFASEDIVKERKAICSQCPNNKAGVCGVCLCVVSLKTLKAHSFCPVGNWNKVEGTNKFPSLEI